MMNGTNVHLAEEAMGSLKFHRLYKQGSTVATSGAMPSSGGAGHSRTGWIGSPTIKGGNTTIMAAGYREIPHPKILCTEHKRPLVDTANISLGLRFCILQRPIQSTKRCN